MAKRKKNIHIVPHTDGWATKTEGSSRAGATFSRQRDAIEAAIPTAKKRGLEVVIHGRDGKIRDKDSYGRDPIPPRDRRH